MSDHLETIRARWADMDWRYEEDRESETYVGDARLIDHRDQVLLDLDEPNDQEQAWLKLAAAAPSDIQALLVVISILQAQLGGWAAQCAAQVDTLREAQTFLRYNVAATPLVTSLLGQIETSIESDAGSVQLLQRLNAAAAVESAACAVIEAWSEIKESTPLDLDLSALAVTLGDVKRQRGA